MSNSLLSARNILPPAYQALTLTIPNTLPTHPKQSSPKLMSWVPYFSLFPARLYAHFSDSSTSFNTCPSLLHTHSHNQSVMGAYRPGRCSSSLAGSVSTASSKAQFRLPTPCQLPLPSHCCQSCFARTQVSQWWSLPTNRMLLEWAFHHSGSSCWAPCCSPPPPALPPPDTAHFHTSVHLLMFLIAQNDFLSPELLLTLKHATQCTHLVCAFPHPPAPDFRALFS